MLGVPNNGLVYFLYFSVLLFTMNLLCRFYNETRELDIVIHSHTKIS